MKSDSIVDLLLCKRSTNNDASAQQRRDKPHFHYRFRHHDNALGARCGASTHFDGYRVNQAFSGLYCKLVEITPSPALSFKRL